MFLVSVVLVLAANYCGSTNDQPTHIFKETIMSISPAVQAVVKAVLTVASGVTTNIAASGLTQASF
jgi:hypothetical protein